MAESPRILIADDSATDRAILRKTLSQLGFVVELARDGEEAWRRLGEPAAPEIAILDWLMPGMTGPEICRALRFRKSPRYVYVIMLTAFDDLADLVEAIEAGADDFITKPFRIQELYARVRAGQRILELQQDLLEAQSALEVRASQDGLTGLLNHVAIVERLGAELERSRRERAPLGVLMIDLDHFKLVNDGYGHRVGDHVLVTVAQRIQAALRAYDCVGRYGGEEFLVVVPGCDMANLMRIANRIRFDASAAPIAVDAYQLTVTLSAGLAVALPDYALDAGALVERADRALYRAKRLGRNRIEGDSGAIPAAGTEQDLS